MGLEVGFVFVLLIGNYFLTIFFYRIFKLDVVVFFSLLFLVPLLCKYIVRLWEKSEEVVVSSFSLFDHREIDQEPLAMSTFFVCSLMMARRRLAWKHSRIST